MDNPPAWHPDPTGRHDHRYWDGESWTDHVADAGEASIDPIEAAPSEAASEAIDPQPSASTVPGAPAEPDDVGSTAVEPGTSNDDLGSVPTTDQRPVGSSESPATPSDAGAAMPVAPPASAAAAPPTATGADSGAPMAPVAASPTPSGGNSLAVLSLVIGIISLLACWTPLVGIIGGAAAVAGVAAVVLVFAIVAILLGVKGRKRAQTTGSGNGMAITGIVLGSLALLATVLFAAMALFFSGFTSDFADLADCIEQTGDQVACTEEFERTLLDRFGQ